MGLGFEELIHRGVLTAGGPAGAMDQTVAAIELELAPRGALLYAFDAERRLIVVGGRLGEAFTGDLSWFGDDPCQDRATKVAGGVVHPTRLVSRRSYTGSTAYREFYALHGIEHIACLRLNGRAHGTPGMWGLFAARGDDHGDFAAEDERRLAAVLPVMAALQTERERLRRLLDGLSDGERRPILVVGADGRIVWSSATARALVPSPPTSLRDAIAAMLAAGKDRGTIVAGSWEVELSPFGEGFLARLRPAREPEARLAERHGLTPTEAAVLACLGEGMSNVEVATALAMTVSTAATHVKRVLAKMRVASRLQAGLLMQREQLRYE